MARHKHIPFKPIYRSGGKGGRAGDKLLGLDLEIATVIPQGEDWRAHRPFGISVAVTWADDHDEPRVWYGQGGPDKNPWPQMPAAQVATLVLWLRCMVDQGYTICTWNGVGFDFSVLAEESGLHPECVELAWGHLDPMWHFFCDQGWAVGLNAVATGTKVGAKTEGINGASAPVLWAEGQYDRVIEYCSQDVRLTLDVCRAALDIGGFYYIDKFSRLHSWIASSGRLLIAREAAKLPLPEPPAWIRDPWPREHFTGWMRRT